MLDDLGETINCPNCGRPNPGWAQICRNCGYSLRRDLARPVGMPQRPFPTDQTSLLSMGAAVGSIVLAIVLGLIFSAVNPTQPTVGVTSPTQSASATEPAVSPSLEPAPSPSSEPTPAPTPKLAGTLTFGTGLNSSKGITGEADIFAPGSTFAHSISSKDAFGVDRLFETVVRVANDGTETPVQTRYPVRVDPKAKVVGFVVSTRSLLSEWHGGGTFVMRVYKDQELFAQAQFELVES